MVIGDYPLIMAIILPFDGFAPFLSIRSCIIQTFSFLNFFSSGSHSLTDFCLLKQLATYYHIIGFNVDYLY